MILKKVINDLDEKGLEISRLLCTRDPNQYREILLVVGACKELGENSISELLSADEMAITAQNLICRAGSEFPNCEGENEWVKAMDLAKTVLKEVCQIFGAPTGEKMPQIFMLEISRAKLGNFAFHIAVKHDQPILDLQPWENVKRDASELTERLFIIQWHLEGCSKGFCLKFEQNPFGSPEAYMERLEAYEMEHPEEMFEDFEFKEIMPGVMVFTVPFGPPGLGE
jgi:hypothetical protein